MTRVLISGADSYLGEQIAAHLTACGMETAVLDVRQPLPEGAFRGYNAVVHVAGIAHRKEAATEEALYFHVNRDLAETVALAAKAQGVQQFVFFSSMSVYGLTCGHITADTQPAPVTLYGKSKLEAEERLNALRGDGFAVAVLRPPMIYGKGCKGNYPRLARLALRLPVFPKANNRRSMLYVGCLCGFVRRLIESGQGGLYFPQNAEYVSTDALVREIARAHGKKLWQPVGFGWLLRLLAPRVGIVGKVFGSLIYDRRMSEAFGDEPQPTFAETIALTEGTDA